MKKWLYFIVPVIGLAIFLSFYFSHKKEAEELAAQQKARVERQTAEEARRKAELEDIARKDAEAKSAERAAADAKRETERKAKWDAEGDKIQKDTDDAIARGQEYAAKITLLKSELADLRARRDQDNHDFLEAARQLEIAKIGRHSADMEIQRVMELIASKAAQSALAAPPPLPQAKSEKSDAN